MLSTLSRSIRPVVQVAKVFGAAFASCPGNGTGAVGANRLKPIPAHVAKLVEENKKNYTCLSRDFYTSPEVFDLDLSRIHGREWLFCGYSFQIPNPGDYFTYKIGKEGIVVVRTKEMQIKAFHNVCRHRGSVVCTKEHGNARLLTCPYHRWSYDLNGQLLLDTAKEFEVDKDTLGLHPVAIEEAAGLLFFSLADNPPDFSEALNTIRRKLKVHGIDKAKVIYQEDYIVNANWKIVFENNRECYHCKWNHKEYVQAAVDVMRDQALLYPEKQPEVDELINSANARFKRLGLDTGDVLSTMTGEGFRCHRTPCLPGYVSQTRDGKLCSTLMGDIKEPDSGTLRTTVFPNFWQHTNCDYAAAARLTPLSHDRTAVRGYFLVDSKAVEGKDYTVDNVKDIWGITNEQDWVICNDQQAGINSSKYIPGPLSKLREKNVYLFDQWYLDHFSK